MEVMLTTAGSLNPPLGFMRLQVVKLFSAFLHTGDSCVHRQIIVLKTLDVLLVSNLSKCCVCVIWMT